LALEQLRNDVKKSQDQLTDAFRTARRTMLLAACGWTGVLLLFAAFQHFNEKRDALNVARLNAANSFQKDIAYRHWAALHGGVYVPVTPKTPPNPALADWPERDITTPSGRKLTLVNPAYMTRQVHELSKGRYGVTGHITSLRPVNPINAPDPWEIAALKAFEKGVKEVSSVEAVNGEPLLRFMRPFVTEKDCLKCHDIHGYKEGDIRGGISLTVPMKPYLTTSANHTKVAWLWGGGVWTLGLLGLIAGHRRMTRMIQQGEEGTRQLRETEGRLRVLYNSMLEGMALHEIICDANGQPCDYRFLQVNPAFERLTGLKAANIIGKTVHEVYPNIDRKWIERYGRVALTGEPCQFEDYAADVGRHFEVAAFCPRKGQFGVTFSDISERKQADLLLRESEERFARAFQTSLCAITITRPEDDRFVEVNDTFTKITGFTREEALGSTSIGLKVWAHEEDRDRVVEDLRAGRPVEAREIEFRKKTGEVIACLFSAQTIRLKEGLCILSSVMDITVRKQTEEALRESRAAALNMMEDAVTSRDRVEEASEALRAREATLQTILEATGDGILAVDNEGKNVIKANKQFAELWRIPQSIIDAGDNIALRDSVLSQLSDPDAFLKRVRELYGTDTVSVDILNFKDGRVFERYGFPMTMNGVVIGRVWSFRDITVRKQAEAKLDDQLRELRRWHEATLGREGRVLELKRQVNELLAKAGQPIRYPSVVPDASSDAKADVESGNKTGLQPPLVAP